MRHLIPLLAVAFLSAEDSATTFAKVKPLLDTACVNCHGAKKAKRDLRLDSVEGVLRGGKTGPAVIPGKADESTLIKVLVLPPKNKHAMPPEGQGDPLTPEQLELLKKWINEGAKP